MADPAVVRALALYGPLALVAAAALAVGPDRRRCGAALLAGLWNLTVLLGVNVLAARAGWWGWGTSGGDLAGVPVDAWLGWALLWGALPALLTERVPAVAVVAGLVWVDLALMPLGQPALVLGSRWLVGEALAVGTALVPGLVLARATIRRERLSLRVGMQVGLFTALLGGVGTQAVLEESGGGWSGLDVGRPVVQLVLEAVALVALPALAAVAELARRGRGTPFPFDPPERLVTTGPYAYVANPMQLSMALVLVAWGAVLGSWPVVGMAVVGTAFAAGVAGWHESVEMERRHGEHWRTYRRSVPAWRPRWRPWAGDGPSAVLYVATGCDPCEGLGRWLRLRRPLGLDIRPASAAPLGITRLTYVDAGLEASGVAAFARALEHLCLAWANARLAPTSPGGRLVRPAGGRRGRWWAAGCAGRRRRQPGVLTQGRATSLGCRINVGT